jgi:hypothetical protein
MIDACLGKRLGKRLVTDAFAKDIRAARARWSDKSMLELAQKHVEKSKPFIQPAPDTRMPDRSLGPSRWRMGLRRQPSFS